MYECMWFCDVHCECVRVWVMWMHLCIWAVSIGCECVNVHMYVGCCGVGGCGCDFGYLFKTGTKIKLPTNIISLQILVEPLF